MLVGVPILPARLAATVSRPFQFLFRPYPAAVLTVLIVVTSVLAYMQLGQSVNLLRPHTALATLIENPNVLVTIFVLLMLSSWFHEFGHLATSSYFGCRHGPLGVGIYSFFRFVIYIAAKIGIVHLVARRVNAFCLTGRHCALGVAQESDRGGQEWRSD